MLDSDIIQISICVIRLTSIKILIELYLVFYCILHVLYVAYRCFGVKGTRSRSRDICAQEGGQECRS